MTWECAHSSSHFCPPRWTVRGYKTQCDLIGSHLTQLLSTLAATNESVVRPRRSGQSGQSSLNQSAGVALLQRSASGPSIAYVRCSVVGLTCFKPLLIPHSLPTSSH